MFIIIIAIIIFAFKSFTVLTCLVIVCTLHLNHFYLKLIITFGTATFFTYKPVIDKEFIIKAIISKAITFREII